MEIVSCSIIIIAIIGGSTWSLTSLSGYYDWRGIASDSTGSMLAAVAYGEGIYVSTSG